MSFWNLTDGESATTGNGNYEAPSGEMDVIPDNTSVLAAPDEATWKTYDGTEYLSLRWRVQKPAAYANRVIFLKLYVTDDDVKAKDPAAKRDKAKKMLAAIDANAGGKLSRINKKPDNDDLALALNNKAMVLKLKTWEMDTADGKKKGNWICAISGKASFVEDAKPAKAQATQDDDGDFVPF